MKFDVFKHRLIKLKNKSLPGVQSHLELAPKNRVQLLKKFKLNSKTHDAGVSLCFYPDLNNDVILPFILRNEYDGVHSNQISLPGGKKEYDDSDLIETSKRETFEEIGIIKENIKEAILEGVIGNNYEEAYKLMIEEGEKLGLTDGK